jgi:hypothetical protein
LCCTLQKAFMRLVFPFSMSILAISKVIMNLSMLLRKERFYSITKMLNRTDRNSKSKFYLTFSGSCVCVCVCVVCSVFICL